MKFRNGYSKQTRVILDCSEDDPLTEQNHKEACDINNILAHYQKTGVLEHRSQYEPIYGDTSPHDFQQSMEIIATAQSMFEELPSQARKRFKNDPVEFLEFVQNSDNAQEAYDMGLTSHPPAKPDPNHLESSKTVQNATGEATSTTNSADGRAPATSEPKANQSGEA